MRPAISMAHLQVWNERLPAAALALLSQHVRSLRNI